MATQHKGSEWDVKYDSPPTISNFMHDNSRMRVLMGPVGAGKSVACCIEIIRRAAMQEPNSKGIRQTRVAVVRQTVKQLQDTTIKTFLDWFPEGVFGEFKRTIKTYYFKFGDIECEIMFRALDDAVDVANLNSLELTFAWFNECRDINAEIVGAMSRRIGRFPSKRDGGPTWYGMWGDTNPPNIGSWWYYMMEHIDPEDGVSEKNNNWAVYKQPSGLSPYAENTENLPEDYYNEHLGQSEDNIRVYVHGEYGRALTGEPVYKHFMPEYHMAKEPLKSFPDRNRPLVVGIDLGLTPAAVIGQLHPKGRVVIYDEIATVNMGIKRFIETQLRPLLHERFSGYPVVIVTDPAGKVRSQTDERSAIDIIKFAGYRVIPAKTNNITPRIDAVDKFLMLQVDGEAGFLIDPRCVRLKAAMIGGYKFHEKKPDQIVKNKHSHIAEALQYLMLHIEGGEIGDTVQTRRVVRAGNMAGHV